MMIASRSPVLLLAALALAVTACNRQQAVAQSSERLNARVPERLNAARYFTIEVVDEETGRGVPLVELRTVNAVRHYTDSNGLVALDEPGLNGQRVWFTVESHGYEKAPDGFGLRGAVLNVEPGKSATIKIRRINLAERLYRTTGEGIYRDSLLVGRKVPVKQPLSNALVMGCDSVQNAVYQGRMFWMWGDTPQFAYPLGNFHMSGATSELPGKGGLDPDKGVDLQYFTGPNGFARGMAPMPGDGPTWLDGVVVLGEGKDEQLFAAYAKIRGSLTTYERGFCQWDPRKGQFIRRGQFPVDAPVIPYGHPEKRKEGGVEYVFFGDPFPLVRVPADVESYQDLSRYEAYTPLKEGSRLASAEIDRDAEGKVRYAWRKNTPPVSPEEQEKLIQQGKLRREEAQFRFRDAANQDKPVVIHRGTVRWNPYRRRWIMLANEIGGTSMLGEVWYAEAEQPQGPWLTARKIVTHKQYSFYNPVHHPEFDQQGGKLIYFEGTYTNSFSGNPDQTPRYDYNQVMYRLDLSKLDPRTQPQ